MFDKTKAVFAIFLYPKDRRDLTLQAIELFQQGFQTSYAVRILVVLGNEFQVMTDVGHLVEQEQGLLVTLTDAVEVLRERVVILQQALLLVDTLKQRHLFSAMGCPKSGVKASGR